uniref:SbcC/MukB-like Walker B domain-containing protein n=1 Tax=uncultured Mitsuokella sp. TaxID=453120 RepID=UPI0026326F10
AAAAAAALKQKKYVQQQLAKSDEAYEVLSEKYRIAGTLADVASGRMGGMNMPFSVYVQRSIFAEVMDAANRRLAIMSRDRYQLVFGDIGEGDRRKKAGLELSVLDSNSGKKRDVKSLSGGESFLASLSLALGLSDIVQEYAGGVRLDTMFIDEGFGALDQEKLDIALNVLTKLHTEGARLVGIISHVEGLEQRIPARLEVTRTASGSRAHFVFGTKEI